VAKQTRTTAEKPPAVHVDDDELLSISAAAKLYGKPRSTFATWVATGIIPSAPMPSGLRAVWKSVVLHYKQIAEQGKIPGTQPE